MTSKLRTPADSVTAPAGGADWQDISTAPKDGTRFLAVGQNYGLDSEAQHTCIAQWLAGCWVEVSDWNGASKLKYLTHWMPLPPLPGHVLEDAARLDWLLLHISGAEFRRIGVHYSGNARRADVDAARAAQEGNNTR